MSMGEFTRRKQRSDNVRSIDALSLEEGVVRPPPVDLEAPQSRGGRRSERVVGDIVAAADLVLIALASLLAKWIYIDIRLGGQPANEPYLAAGVLAAVVAVATFRSRELYRLSTLRRLRGQTLRILGGLGVAAVILLTAGYLLKVSADFSRGWMIIWFVLNVMLVALNHGVAAHFIGSRAPDRFFQRNIAIYGSGDIAFGLIEHLRMMNEHHHVVGVFDDAAQRPAARLAVSGGVGELIEHGKSAHIDEVIIALPLGEERRISDLLMQLSVLPVDIRLCPALATLRMRSLGIVNYGGVSVIELARRPLDGWAPIIKLVEDRLLSALGLIAVAPLMLLIAIAIKLDSKGPVFFRQRRHGFNHTIIRVMKFRTMHVTEDGPEIRQAVKGDPRVTRVGRVLRSTSLDELPQLFNVLMGEMSLVGPRPHALAHNEYYEVLLEQYANRHKMKPGITGWAQVNGHRGETDTPEKMRKRVEYDLHYIENWSLWLDIKILLMTPFFGFTGRNAY